MEIYQTHEHHGRHIAYDHNEAKRNNDNGWETVSKEEFYGKKEDNPLPDREKLELAYIAKFDKKPPHNMKDSTIQAKLDE